MKKEGDPEDVISILVGWLERWCFSSLLPISLQLQTQLEDHSSERHERKEKSNRTRCYIIHFLTFGLPSQSSCFHFLFRILNGSSLYVGQFPL